MAITMAQFSRNIRRRGSNIENNSILAVQRVSKAALRGLVKGTPVDEGVARSNWRVSVGGRATAVIPAYSPGKNLGISETANATATIQQGIAKINRLRSSVRRRAEAGQSVTISNNIEYLQFLREGSSAQQPNDWVADAINTARRELLTIRFLSD